MSGLTQFLEERIPARAVTLRRRFRRLASPAWLGTRRSVAPLSSGWGFDRGQPIDRYYIEQFLARNQADIRGDVLEIKDSSYTDRYGIGVRQRAVLDVDASNPVATIIADLAHADAVPEASFDCFILTQTLHLIFDLQAAIAHSYRILRPGGVLLVTAPVVSRLLPRIGLTADYWRLTPASCRVFFGQHFGEEQITVQSYGNVLTGMAFLTGVAVEELRRAELDYHDDYFPLLMTVRAVKREH